MMIIVAVPFMTAIPNMEQPLPHNLHIYRSQRNTVRTRKIKSTELNDFSIEMEWKRMHVNAYIHRHSYIYIDRTNQRNDRTKIMILLHIRRTKQTKGTEEQNGRVVHAVSLYI